ncbi:hypothetical protein [Enterococcus crotali]|uniref:hypothetical protein n=1 Tax=Enterococcus crotali TaxID=1453587 RepID=UPI0004727EC7|nr:hypothetical protein [Enterococcus crotali]
MDWANTIKNSWATRDKRLMEKQLEEYQIYAVIYNDKDGNPKVIWKVTKDGAGVKNPKIYQYLNANGKDLPSDLFEFMSQQDWDDKVKVAFRNGKDLQIGDKYNPVLGALVATGQYFEDAYKFMTEDELGQALQMLGFNFASYRLATNKGTKTVENKNTGGADQKVIEEIINPIIEAPRSGSGLKVDDIKPVKGKGSVYDIDPLTGKPPTKQTQIIIDEFPNVPKAHGFTDIIDNYAGLAEVTDLGNAKLYQIQRSQNGVMGRFEWIIQDEKVTHRMFVRNPELNGVPIK